MSGIVGSVGAKSGIIGSTEIPGGYEEGIWTPEHTDITFSNAVGQYTKIGRVVMISGYVVVSSGGSHGSVFTNLPFTSGVYVYGAGGGNAIWDDMATYGSRHHAFCRVVENTPTFHIVVNDPSTGWSTIINPSTGHKILFYFEYMVGGS